MFTTSGGVVRVEYDSMGGIAAIRSETHGTSWVPDGPMPPTADAHDSSETKRVYLAGREAVGVQPYYGSVVFDPETFAVASFEPLWLVPGLEDALDLWSVAEPLLQFGHDGAVAFDKPSNPAFQPDEYLSTNCCLPCTPYTFMGCGCQLLEELLVVCGCLPADEPDPTEKNCLPCDPPVGTEMYVYNDSHPPRVAGGERRNHGVPGTFHYHHYRVAQSTPTTPIPCKCNTPKNGNANAFTYAGEIMCRCPTGGGIEGC